MPLLPFPVCPLFHGRGKPLPYRNTLSVRRIMDELLVLEMLLLTLLQERARVGAKSIPFASAQARKLAPFPCPSFPHKA